MKNLTLGAGALAALCFVLSLIGRFHHEPTLTLLGIRFQAITFLVLANTFLLAGIYLHLVGGGKAR